MLAGSALIPQHPLGNFTVNRYDGLVAAPHELRIDHVQDLAEIPAAQVLEELPALRGGTGLPAWAVRSCATASRVFQITESGRLIHPTVRAATARTRPGQAGLPTLRLECTMTAPLAGRPGGEPVTFRDPGAADHVGWHEITAAGDRMTIVRASVPAASRSARLTSYPKDMLSSPLDQRSASFTVTPGGPALGAPAAPGAPAGILPRGVDRLTQSFTDLVARRHLTAGFALAALLIAVALGAVHALAPGHGKTIMAAHAVSRGRRGLRDILTLGLTVTVTHTLGVLVLGLLVAGGSSVVTPGLFPWLGAASGALVALAGCTLLRRALRQPAAHAHAHAHGDGHGHGDRDGDGDGDGHEHCDGHGHGDGDGDGHERPHADMPRRGTIVIMGFAGGLMPSPSAVVVLLGAVALGHAWFGMLLVLAYGLGLAATLTGIGVFITGSGRWLAARVPGLRDRAHRIPARLVPAGSAALVVLLGAGLAARSLAAALG
jgi:ABC-type nickel/cobalt efflux system permease component RcnA